jgi:hypothetical protein
MQGGHYSRDTIYIRDDNSNDFKFQYLSRETRNFFAEMCEKLVKTAKNS